MPSCLDNMEETLVPVPGSHVGSFMSSQDANDRCLPHGLGSDLRGTLESMSVEGPSSLMAHQPSGDVGCISCSQEFQKQSSGATMCILQTGVPNPPVVSREVVVSASNLHPWGPQYRSRHPVETGAEAQEMEAPPRCGGAVMEGVRPGTSRSVCISRDVSLSTLVLPHTSSSSRTGCDDTDVAEVVETILHSRAPSMRKLYALKWKVFTSWCSDHQVDPVNCPVGTVLEFLQDRFTAGLAPSTLKVYVAAISAYHITLGGMSMGKDPLVSRFLRGTLRLRPAARTRVLTWDLAIVLQGLSLAPFEPLEEVPAKFLTLKALFLLAISSLKRIGDLQALSVAPSCLEFAPGMVKAFIHPRPG